MIETIKKSVLKIENELDDALVFFKGKPYTKRESYWRPLLLTSHLALIDNLIKELEGKKKGEADIIDGLQDTWNGGYDRAINDTITTLQALREEITSLIK
jgi:hypothetical protein